MNKIDFVVLFTVDRANPNGDPLNGNRPRITYDGFGEISDVCIKRKIRNRLQDEGHKIFVQSDDRCDDGCKSLKDRATILLKKLKNKGDKEEIERIVCSEWIDVRSFGQVFAFKGKKQKTDKKDNKKEASEEKGGVSVSVRGPVSIHIAQSCSPIEISSMQITKSVNSETDDKDKKGSDTMGSKHFVRFGLYKIKGSINPQLAEKTSFTESDAEAIKEALCTLFDNDASSARPEGSLTVAKVYWWEHNNKSGQYPTFKVHNSVHVDLKDGVINPKSIDDYNIQLEELDGLKPEVFDLL